MFIEMTNGELEKLFNLPEIQNKYIQFIPDINTLDVGLRFVSQRLDNSPPYNLINLFRVTDRNKVMLLGLQGIQFHVKK
jgi:hypothetical protein